MTDAVVTRLSGPVLHARALRPFQLNEAALVGADQLLGEVIRIDRDEIVLQIYEDTTGLRPGAEVAGTGAELSVRLGPRLLGHIYDGLLRPLHKQGTGIRPGVHDWQSRRHYNFVPTVSRGDRITGGTVIGTLLGEGARPQRCLAPPWAEGEVIEIVERGDYLEYETLCVLRTPSGASEAIAMVHPWPVRRPRPVRERLAINDPLFTGQRVIDSLFPLGCGGRAAMPGGFGTGKTVLQETLAKWCDADVIVYVGCGERGNEMASVLHEFPVLEDPRTGRPLMERTVIIANTSNMPVAAREASIYTAATVAEYFRDQGLRVALMADSTSRWAEALREVSGRLGELPGEAGYPAYLSSRQADFYERAALVRTLNGETGSLTIIGAVSPPSADFSEPVTIHTKRYARCFWALDTGRAQARFYPAIHPLQSYSEDVDVLTGFWARQGNPAWPRLRRLFLNLLEEQARLERMARIVGKDALPPRQQHVMLCAELINEAFLRQSAFSPVDRFCVVEKQVAMMQLIGRFIELSESAIGRGAAVADISALPVMRRLRRIGEEIDEDAPDAFEALRQKLEADFAGLAGRAGNDAG
ncbi:MAG: V-type ATP synthase subunit A [Thiogranum sp.]|jgi:V/A-type H+-transporting ATPase subunit A